MRKKLIILSMSLAIAMFLIHPVVGNTKSIPLADYKALNSEEVAIKAMMLERQEAFRTGNTETVLARMHDKGKFMVFRKMHSKAKFTKLLPKIFKICSDTKWQNLRIRVSGSKANVWFKLSTSKWKIYEKFELVKVDGRWLIKRITYK